MIKKLLNNINVHIDPNKHKAEKAEVLVGLGDTQIDNDGIVLQHKTELVHYESLSEYVYKKIFSSFELENCCDDIYIEDFSVDTILSLWIFLQKRSENIINDNILAWIDYANRWEHGDTFSTGKPFESYGCLQNALALHLQDELPKNILKSSLVFLDYLIVNNIDPAHIPNNIGTALYINAKAMLKNEYGKYEDIISKSEIQILYIPNENKENIEVSAIFIETNIISSIQKVFLRNDEKSPTGDGYALMAVYNPFVKGTGNDIVISIDPIKKIHLKALWKVLEREEDLLWNAERPKDNPRPLASYPDNNGPNQPWWDDMGNYTLIAAPKMVGEKYGRRIGWKRVKQLIKQLYSDGANK